MTIIRRIWENRACFRTGVSHSSAIIGKSPRVSFRNLATISVHAPAANVSCLPKQPDLFHTILSFRWLSEACRGNNPTDLNTKDKAWQRGLLSCKHRNGNGPWRICAVVPMGLRPVQPSNLVSLQSPLSIACLGKVRPNTRFFFDHSHRFQRYGCLGGIPGRGAPPHLQYATRTYIHT
jgi:hypothetical protein